MQVKVNAFFKRFLVSCSALPLEAESLGLPVLADTLLIVMLEIISDHVE